MRQRIEKKRKLMVKVRRAAWMKGTIKGGRGSNHLSGDWCNTKTYTHLLWYLSQKVAKGRQEKACTGKTSKRKHCCKWPVHRRKTV